MPKSEIENRNFLSSLRFKFTLNRAPKVAYFTNKVNIPSMNLGVAMQPSYTTDIPVPGEKIVFGDFDLTFLVDEDLTNYLEIQKWIRGIGFPESLGEIYDWQNDRKVFESPRNSDMNLYSDGTLLVHTSNNNTNYQIRFRGMFPYILSELTFDATNDDEEYFTSTVSFKYMMYNILDKEGNYIPLKYS
jgi:hypothetical protein